MTSTPHVRRARPEDLRRIAELAAEHAAYEQAVPPPGDLAERLAVLLFDGPSPRLRCFVADPDPDPDPDPGSDPGSGSGSGSGSGAPIGYATCAPELSTWDGAEYLHLDCLFLRDGHRGHGLGALLMDAVLGEARALGLAQVQWQTPPWNTDAIRFYDRLGGRATTRQRYSLPSA
ncbi:GNAT family N-acetyltransferase [Kitasatospora sp. NPDC101801]|uniref:GNAT family N-acetyltransferase n=1 Tax=Kitasatospora sp. NPDC101801 TaxID=3364103 RepID=UPI0037F208B4